MKNKILFLGLAMLLCVINAFAQGGTTGPLTWIRKGDTLFIRGIGAMPDYEKTGSGNNVPWGNSYNSIKIVIIGDGVTSIGNWAFERQRALSSITIPNSVTRIGKFAFSECQSLPSIDIPSGVTSIEVATFASCFSLKSVTLPSGTASIDESAFAFCHALETITLPSGIMSIGHQAFFNCVALTSVTNLNPTPITIDPLVFRNVNISACKLYVPKHFVSDYQNAEVWKEFIIEGIEVGIGTKEKDGFNIYPNPTTGILHIVSEEWKIENVEIFDVYGRSVLSYNLPIFRKATVNISHFSVGIYFVKISTEKGEVIKKVLKE